MTSTRRPVILVSIAAALSLLSDMVLYAVLPVPSYQRLLGLTPFHVGLLLSVNRWIRLLTNQLAERLCRRFSSRALLAGALALGALLPVVYATAGSFVLLLAARIVWGLCWSFIRQVSIVTVVESTPVDRVAQGMGLYTLISRTGSATATFGGALLCDAIGFGPAMFCISAVCLTAVWPGVRSQDALRHVTRGQPERETSRGGAGGSAVYLFISGFTILCAASIVATTMGWALEERAGASIAIWGVAIGVATLNGLVLAGRWFCTLAAPWLGGVSDRIGHWRGSCAFFSIGAGAVLVAMLAPGLLGLVLPVLGLFVCSTALTVTLSAEAGRWGTRAVALFVTAADAGSAAGPLLGGLALRELGNANAPFALACVFLAVGAGASWLAVRKLPSGQGGRKAD